MWMLGRWSSLDHERVVGPLSRQATSDVTLSAERHALLLSREGNNRGDNTAAVDSIQQVQILPVAMAGTGGNRE